MDHNPDLQSSNQPELTDEAPFDSRSRLEYLNIVNPRKPKRRWLRILLILLLVAGMAAGGWYVYDRFIKQPPVAESEQTSAPKTTKPIEETVEVATEHHDSSTLNLGFDYPEKWLVADNGDGKITVTSPGVNQKNAASETEIVRTVMTIAAKGQNLVPFDKGSGLAVNASEKIKYTNPTSVQRAETYLTFVQYSTTASGEGLDALYITGDYGYKKGQYIPKADMLNLDPVIAISFEKCSDSKCVNATPVATSVPLSLWADEAFSKPILVMLRSISVN
jgi:hypothetical protein